MQRKHGERRRIEKSVNEGERESKTQSFKRGPKRGDAEAQKAYIRSVDCRKHVTTPQ